jgi:hypothetical protein
MVQSCNDKCGMQVGFLRKTVESGGSTWQKSKEQKATTPEVFANEQTSSLVQGESNHFWMLTENNRRAIVDKRICEHITKESESKHKCSEISLGSVTSRILGIFLYKLYAK